MSRRTVQIINNPNKNKKANCNGIVQSECIGVRMNSNLRLPHNSDQDPILVLNKSNCILKTIQNVCIKIVLKKKIYDLKSRFK